MNLPVEVIEAVNQGRCVLFVGSRFTGEAAEEQGLTYPEPKELARELGWKRPKQLMGGRARPARPSALEGAASYAREHGRAALEQRLAELVGATQVKPAGFHKTALSRFPLIFTTCQDQVMERAAVEMGGQVQVLYRGAALPELKADQRTLYKLNGGFEQPGSLVIEGADRGPMEEAVRRQIRDLVRGHVVFFVGYRPDSEEFEAVFDDLTQCYGGELPRCHLAVAQGQIDDFLWQKWVWRGLLMFTADPSECMAELEARIEH